MENIMNTLPDNHISNETLWTYKDNIEIFNKYNQQQVIQKTHKIIKPKEEPPKKEELLPKQEEPPKKEEPPKNKKTNRIESPLDIIIKFTSVDKIMKQDIKNKLIEFISEPEFSKAFGLKKSSEIMTALTKDSWNQSISLFISFFLNKHIIYKEKSYSYYKNKEEVIINVS
jgi:hypothetical protein